MFVVMFAAVAVLVVRCGNDDDGRRCSLSRLGWCCRDGGRRCRGRFRLVQIVVVVAFVTMAVVVTTVVIVLVVVVVVVVPVTVVRLEVTVVVAVLESLLW